MPRLRDAKIPIGRKLYMTLLKIGNAAVILYGVITVVMSFEINPTPEFSPGWLLILLGGTTMVAGLTGFGGTTLPCCYMSHLILMTIAIFGSGVFCLVIFGQRSKVVASFESTRWSEATVDHYLSGICWFYLFVSIFEMCTLVGRVIFQRFQFQQFETVDQTRDARNLSMGKIRREIGDQSDKVERTKANNIGDKMKDKYAKWSHESWADPN